MRPKELLVFSDDWGRHPSSCQHLIGQLLDQYPVHWINTIGTRLPSVDLYTLQRGLSKVGDWFSVPASSDEENNPRVLSPLMWPSFRTGFSRRLNRFLLSQSLQRSLPLEDCAAVTTIPLVADLVGKLPVRRWTYYCVDDLSEWPGLDKRSLERMERELVEKVDEVIAVSHRLVDRMNAMGRDATLLTHGVDLEHWARSDHDQADENELGETLSQIAKPLIVFWGVVDKRLNVEWIRRLNKRLQQGTILLIGPENNPAKELSELENVRLHPPLPYNCLPAVARSAAVLIMPYGHMPATHAMQPLKLKEYLATGKPVVTSDLPAVIEWADACDVVSEETEFVERIVSRCETGLPESQKAARHRLQKESWRSKAQLFEKIMVGEPE